MASNSEQSRLAEAELADFRITNLNANGDSTDVTPAPRSAPLSTHGVIRGLPKSRYDSLVKDNPLAALSYLDEDDGEIITVGSSYELDERLKEPFNPALAPRPPFGASSVHPDDIQLLHTFDLSSRDGQTVQLWRSLQASRTVTASARPTATIPIWARAKSTDAHGKTPSMGHFELDRFLHWASGLPLAADPSSSATAGHTRERHNDKALQTEEQLCGESDLPRQNPGDLGVNHSTEGKLTPEDVEVAAGSDAVPASADASAAGVQLKPLKPLLEQFEAELAKMISKNEAPSAPASSETQPSNTTTSPGGESQSTDPDESVPLAHTAGPASPAELLTSTLSSLLSGLGNFATRVDEANPQIREQLAQAHAAGQGAAFNFLSRLIPEIQSRAAAAGIRTEPAPPSPARDCPEVPQSMAAEASSQTSVSPPNPHRARAYEAERILASRYICYDNGNFIGPRHRQYLVRWAGCGPADDVWYDEDNLKTSCQPLIDMYERTRSQTAIQAHEAAQLHRRTAGNRMMTSTVSQGQDSISRGEAVQLDRHDVRYPIRGDAMPTTAPTLDSKQPQDQAAIAESERAPKRSTYSFDPRDIMTQRVPMSIGRDLDVPLRRAKSLAFRNMPSVSFTTKRGPDDQTSSISTKDISSQKALPCLRRAATTIHRHVDNRSRGAEAAEALFNNFEAARGRYLPRRAATTRSAYREGERRSDQLLQSDKVMRCADDLIGMGYRRSEAEPVAAICDGDVSKALDQLEEDRKAWLWRSSHEALHAPADAAGGSMPGSWDIYRW